VTPREWTPEERISAASKLLGIIQSDIPGGRYGFPGRPNVTSVLHVLHEAPEVLNQNLDSLEKILELAEDERRSYGQVHGYDG